MAQVGRIASGYVYYVSLKGVTGAGHLDTAAVGRMLPRIRAHVTRAGRRRLRHPRRRDGAGRRPSRRRGGDRHGAHPADRRRSRARMSPPRPAGFLAAVRERARRPGAEERDGDPQPERPHELARKTAAAEDPADRPDRAPHRARRPVGQVPDLRDGALQDRPRAEPERLPEVQPPPPHRRARAARRASSTPKAATRSARKCCRSTRSSSRTAASTPSA